MFFGVLALWVLFAGMAMAEDAWWNHQWKYRKKISVNTGAAGADIKAPLAEVAVLLRLHSGNFNFAAVKPDGSDIRPVTADNKTPLKYHIERFDSVDELALVWVKLPALSPQTSQDFFLYYGNAEAPNAQDPKTGADGFTTALFHFAETEGPPQDGGPAGLHPASFAGTQGLAGTVGSGFGFSGPGDHIAWEPTPIFNLSKGMTFSMWVRLNQTLDDAVLLLVDSPGMFLEIGLRSDVPFSRVALKTEESTLAKDVKGRSAGPVAEVSGANALEQGKWHHLAVSASSKSRLVLYIDGVEAGNTKIDIGLPEAPAGLRLGSDLAEQRQFVGDIDVFQISAAVRLADWVKAAFASQGADTAMIAYDVEMQGETPSQQLVYLKIIIGAITLDGLIIISVIAAFGGWVWVVFVGKILSFRKLARENGLFMGAFRKLADPLAATGDVAAFDGSGLSRLYRAVRQYFQSIAALCDCGPDTAGKPISAGSIAQFKATLERGYVEETQRLNASIAVLPMAISGGPFLGLLGTVWGVMNTFAAMADAGEANIMAIAPGIASALATTVAGLLVAIPALFAYNYLVGRIKDFTVELALFIDELTVTVETRTGAAQ